VTSGVQVRSLLVVAKVIRLLLVMLAPQVNLPSAVSHDAAAVT
jgi:hypothetical protein